MSILRSSLRRALVSLPKTSSLRCLTSTANADEIAFFSARSAAWWDESGEFALLHRMNGPRMQWITEHMKASGSGLAGKLVVDVGCGGGLLSESVTRLGAVTTAIDASESNIKIAKAHASHDPKLKNLTYLHCTTADMLPTHEGTFDILTAMEVVEHVDNPHQFLSECASLVKPGGLIFLSTINRSFIGHFLTITLAEQALGLVSHGTHDSSKFVKPQELRSFFTRLGWDPSQMETRGIAYLPWASRWQVGSANSSEGWIGDQANYLFVCRKPIS